MCKNKVFIKDLFFLVQISYFNPDFTSSFLDTATMIASSILRLGRTVPPRSFTRFDCSFGSTSAKIHFSFQA